MRHRGPPGAEEHPPRERVPPDPGFCSRQSSNLQGAISDTCPTRLASWILGDGWQSPTSPPARVGEMFHALALLPVVLHGLAAFLSLNLAVALDSRLPLGLAWLCVPAAYVIVLCAGAVAVARPVAGRIQEGRFQRSPADRDYLARRVHGAAWTTLFYCKPVLSLVLGSRPLRGLVLRGFGYRGSLDVTLYPDTWVRDLPLLDLADGVYVSNRATLGTNVVDGARILVSGIKLGERSVVGHLALVGGGLVAGADVAIGQGAAVGFRVRIGDGTYVGPCAQVGHASRRGERVVLGHGVGLGDRCRIADGLSLPDGLLVPAGTRLRRQADVDALVAPAIRPARALAG